MNLSLKIIGSVGLALATLLALFGGILVDDEQLLLRDLLSRRGVALAQVIADFSIESLVVEDYPVLETALSTVGGQTEDILSISVLQNGHPVAQFSRDSDATGTRTVRDILLFGPGDAPPQDLGQVQLVLSDRANREFIAQRRRKMWLFVGIFFVVLAASLGAILQRLVLGRVERLTRFAEKITSQQSHGMEIGNPVGPDVQSDPAPPTITSDEIGRLAWSLGALERTIEEKDTQLRRYTTDLERTVEERTAELQRAKERAESSDRSKSLFLANMSHEIRTPMNGVLGFTRLLAQGPLDSRQQEYVQTIATSAENLQVIIDDILSYSKLEAGRMEIVEGPFDLQLLVDSTLRLFSPEAYRKGLELIHGIALGTPTRLIGDPVRIRQVITNLLGNALKFTREGCVSLWIEKVDTASGSLVRFQVGDTGIGLDGAQASQLFSPFTQGDASVTRRFGGTGLGLAICKQLVERMQGKIRVSSVLQEGSLFWFELPLRTHDDGVKEPDRRPGLIGRKAWLYEPHSRAERAIRHNLLRMGLEVQSLPSAEVLGRLGESASDERPDLLVLGVGDATQLAELQAQLPEQIPMRTLLLCNRASPRPEDCGIQAELALAKACGFHQLAEEIERLIDPAAAAPQPEPGKPRPPPSLSGLRVLVVDDNAINLELTKTIVSSAGVEAIPATSGEEAVRLAKQERPDLILMDIQMPGMSGLEATRMIRSQDPNRHTPIIAVTAHAFPEEQQEFLAQGMDDCVTKPLYPDQLWELIAHWTGAEPAPSDAEPPLAETPPPQGPEANAVYDRPRAIEMAGGEAQARRIWDLLMQRLPQDLQDLEQARSQGDREHLRRVAHSLRGSATYCATPDLLETASALDQAAAQGENSLDQRAADLERSIRTLLALG